MWKMLQRLSALILITSALVVGGCSSQSTVQSSSANPAPSQTASPAPASSPQTGNLPRLGGKATVAMTVKGSTVTIEVNGTDAPITAGNFIDLVQRGFYDGLVFHRVVPEFVVQGGDPQSKNPNFPPGRLGTGSFIDPATKQVRYIPLEIKPQGGDQPVYHQTLSRSGVTGAPKLKHTRGAVAMARSEAPDSASSQFYVTLADVNFLDGDYAVFGYVTQGMEAIDKIQEGDRIESIKITKGAENLKKG